MRSAFVVVLFCASLVGCYRTKNLAAPPIPTKTVPVVSHGGSPSEGLARVILDSDRPALVEKVSGGSIGGVAGSTAFNGAIEMRSRLCITPCVVDLSPGPYELRFTSVSDDNATSSGFINVDTQASIYRHSLGRQENNAWKGFVGWPVASIGAFNLLGMATLAADGQSGGAIGFGVVGAILTSLGGWLIYGSTVIDQPGSGMQWHPAPQ